MNAVKSARGDEGFTLIEVMIALAVLAVGILGAIDMVGVSLKSGRAGKDLTIANNLAKQELEDMKNIGYTSAINNMQPHAVLSGYSTVYIFGNRSSFGTLLPNLSTIQWVSSSNKNFKIGVVVHENEPSHNLASVRVRVYWQTAERSHKVSYDTFFSMI